jgi:S1-C subfamily serine protease
MTTRTRERPWARITALLRRRHAHPTATVGVPRAPTTRLLAGAAVLAAVLIAIALLALSGDPEPTASPAVAPLRVTSGSEIATGFAVGRDRVVTVAHLADGAVRDGGALTVDGIRAKVLRVDRRSDLALLAVPGITGRSPAVAAAGAGDGVRILRLRDGLSSSLSVRVRRAIVAHIRAPDAPRAVTRPALELAARVRAGDSGAPVVARSGALAGVVFAVSSRRGNTAYAVDASALPRLLARD